MDLQKESAALTGTLENWFTGLSKQNLSELVRKPEKTAIISVDMINGFCYTGTLASPRSAAIVPAITDLFRRLQSKGVRHFVLTQDTHDENAVEFGSFPPHCLRGSDESEAVDAFKALPFFNEFKIFPKNSINSALNTGLPEWIDQHPEIDTFIVVGVCTDLCIYQMAMYLRLDANSRQLSRRVVVPENCVQTYDTPVEAAVANNIPAHPGDLTHVLALYHMYLNGIEIIKELE
jgi:nicotinamidase-related amidase